MMMTDVMWAIAIEIWTKKKRFRQNIDPFDSIICYSFIYKPKRATKKVSRVSVQVRDQWQTFFGSLNAFKVLIPIK